MKPKLYIETPVICTPEELNRREPVISDPIVEEVRRTRREIEAEHGNDWKALERYFVDKQNIAPHKQVVYQPKKLPASVAHKRPRAGRRREAPTGGA